MITGMSLLPAQQADTGRTTPGQVTNVQETDRLKTELENEKEFKKSLLAIIFILLTFITIVFVFSMRRQILINATLKRNQRQLEAQKSELEHLSDIKTKLFGILAHDVRSPLASFKGYATMLVRNIDSLEKSDIVKMGTLLLASIDQTLKTTEGISTWAKTQLNEIKTEIEPVNITRIIDEVIDINFASLSLKGVTLNFMKGDEFTISADKTQIAYILRNLVSSAIRFCEECGNITIQLRSEMDRTHVLVTADSFNQADENLLTPATEKFTGLGLMLSHEFAIRNGGKLQVSCNRQQGAVFALELPA